MKFISLFERSGGRITKNESFTFDEMRAFLITKDQEYYNHWFFGKSRKATLDRILKKFKTIIDMDEEGNHKIRK